MELRLIPEEKNRYLINMFLRDLQTALITNADVMLSRITQK